MDAFENELSFPKKPTFEEKQDVSSKSFISIVLFLVISYFFFGKNISLVLTVTAILFIHELGHLLAMRYFHYKEVKIFFIPLLGAYTKGEKQEVSQKQRIIVSLAGPIPSILIAIGLYYYGYNNHNNSIYHAAYYMFIINIFNLLPINPLDGGRIIESLFDNSKKNLFLVFNIVSVILLSIIVIYLKSYILLIIPALIIIGIIRQFKIKRIREGLSEINFNFNKTYNELTDNEYWSIRTEVLKSFSIYPKINPELVKLSEQENKIMKLVKLVTVETKQVFDITERFRNRALFILVLGIIVALSFIKVMKDNDPKKTRLKTMYEQLTYNQIQDMKRGCISKLPKNISYEKKVEYCDCSIDKILLLKREDFERILKLPKAIQADSLKPLIMNCLPIISDTSKIKNK